VIGLSIFLLRGEQGLNIDFVGGTAYTGQLKHGEARTIGQLRDLLGHEHQKERLAVASVEQRDTEGKNFLIAYTDGDKQTVAFADPAVSASASAAERETNVKKRASEMPDWSVEQTILSEEANEYPKGASRVFTVRTTEKEADLVQVSVDRLMTEAQGGQTV